MSYFQALRHAKCDRARLEKDLALFANRGFNYIRVLSMVSWDGLEIAPVSFTNRQGRLVEGWPDYWDRFRELLDLAAQHGLRVEVTIFADAQIVMPSAVARRSHLEGVLRNITGREQHFLFLEVANEAWQNGFPGEEGVRDLRLAAQYLAERTDVLVAITSNDDPRRRGIGALYRGSAADLATVHFSRDTRTAEGGWLPVRDAFRAGRSRWSSADHQQRANRTRIVSCRRAGSVEALFRGRGCVPRKSARLCLSHTRGRVWLRPLLPT